MTAAWLAFDAALAVAVTVGAWIAWRREQRRAAGERFLAAVARHLELAGGVHACCRLVGGVQCGLWCCHAGPCTTHLPGSYLPAALIHPLALARLTGPIGRRCCPLCGRPVNGWQAGVQGLYVTVIDGISHDSVEQPWQFQPCGCSGRVIA